MAASPTDSYRNGLSPAEVAFIAESTYVHIQPRQAMPSLDLIEVLHLKRHYPKSLDNNIGIQAPSTSTSTSMACPSSQAAAPRQNHPSIVVES
jgi:hypothetical protein